MQVMCSVCRLKADVKDKKLVEHNNKRGTLCYGSYTPAEDINPFVKSIDERWAFDDNEFQQWGLGDTNDDMASLQQLANGYANVNPPPTDEEDKHFIDELKRMGL